MRLTLTFAAALSSFAMLAGDAKPSVVFEKAIGDIRGLGFENLSAAVAPDGGIFLLSADGRLSEFAPDCRYKRSFKAQVSWPNDKFKVDIVNGMILVGDSAKDYPWAFDGRRAGSEKGRFLKASDVVEDEAGNIYVAETGNSRIQVFSPSNIELPSDVVELKAKPQRLAVSKGCLAVAFSDGSLSIFRKENGVFTSFCQAKPGPLKSLRFTPSGALLLASQDDLKLYSIESDGLSTALKLSSVIAPSWRTKWPSLLLNPVPFCKAPDGSICFASSPEGSLLALDPATDAIAERKGLPRSVRAICFAKDGALLAGCDGPKDGEKSLMKFKLGSSALDPLGSFSGKPLYAEAGVPVWGLLPDPDGGVYVRVVKPGHDKGWPALDIDKVYSDGHSKPFLSYKSLYAVRSVFGPWEGYYSMKFAKDGSIVLVSTQLLSVQKLSPDGKAIWEAGLVPKGGAALVHFKRPRDIDIDSQGRIWVADSEADKAFCLSPDGALLLEFGSSGGVDDLSGSGMDGVSGLAIAKLLGGEFLYLGDAGNKRILKYRIK